MSTVLTGSDGELTARVVVENRYPSEETFSLCFDVFSPEGRVEEYGTKRVTLPAGDRDTVTLRATIYGAGKSCGAPRNPPSTDSPSSSARKTASSNTFP